MTETSMKTQPITVGYYTWAFLICASASRICHRAVSGGSPHEKDTSMFSDEFTNYGSIEALLPIHKWWTMYKSSIASECPSLFLSFVYYSQPQVNKILMPCIEILFVFYLPVNQINELLIKHRHMMSFCHFSEQAYRNVSINKHCRAT